MLTEKQRDFLEERGGDINCEVCTHAGSKCPGFQSTPNGPWFPPCSDCPWESWVDVGRLNQIMKEYEEDA